MGQCHRYDQIAHLSTSCDYSFLKQNDRDPLQCFVGYFILINIITAPHFDSNDIPDGWVVSNGGDGEFTGGNLFLPDIGMAYHIKVAMLYFYVVVESHHKFGLASG